MKFHFNFNILKRKPLVLIGLTIAIILMALTITNTSFFKGDTAGVVRNQNQDWMSRFVGHEPSNTNVFTRENLTLAPFYQSGAPQDDGRSNIKFDLKSPGKLNVPYRTNRTTTYNYLKPGAIFGDTLGHSRLELNFKNKSLPNYGDFQKVQIAIYHQNTLNPRKYDNSPFRNDNNTIREEYSTTITEESDNLYFCGYQNRENSWNKPCSRQINNPLIPAFDNVTQPTLKIIRIEYFTKKDNTTYIYRNWYRFVVDKPGGGQNQSWMNRFAGYQPSNADVFTRHDLKLYNRHATSEDVNNGSEDVIRNISFKLQSPGKLNVPYRTNRSNTYNYIKPGAVFNNTKHSELKLNFEATNTTLQSSDQSVEKIEIKLYHQNTLNPEQYDNNPFQNNNNTIREEYSTTITEESDNLYFCGYQNRENSWNKPCSRQINNPLIEAFNHVTQPTLKIIRIEYYVTENNNTIIYREWYRFVVDKPVKWTEFSQPDTTKPILWNHKLNVMNGVNRPQSLEYKVEPSGTWKVLSSDNPNLPINLCGSRTSNRNCEANDYFIENQQLNKTLFFRFKWISANNFTYYSSSRQLTTPKYDVQPRAYMDLNIHLIDTNYPSTCTGEGVEDLNSSLSFFEVTKTNEIQTVTCSLVVDYNTSQTVIIPALITSEEDSPAAQSPPTQNQSARFYNMNDGRVYNVNDPKLSVGLMDAQTNKLNSATCKLKHKPKGGDYGVHSRSMNYDDYGILSIQLSNLKDGEYKYKINCNTPNISSPEYTFYILTEKPIIEVVENQTFYNPKPTIRIISDGTGCSIDGNKLERVEPFNVFQWTPTQDLESGEHSKSVSCTRSHSARDIMGNTPTLTERKNFTFTINLDEEKVAEYEASRKFRIGTKVTPTNDSTVSNRNTLLRFYTIDVQHHNLDKITCSLSSLSANLDKETVKTSKGVIPKTFDHSYKLSQLPNGTHNFTIECKDGDQTASLNHKLTLNYPPERETNVTSDPVAPERVPTDVAPLLLEGLLTCNTTVYTGYHINCSGRLPEGRTNLNGLNIWLASTNETPPRPVENTVQNCTKPAENDTLIKCSIPNAPKGNYKIMASQNGQENSPYEVGNVAVIDPNELISVQVSPASITAGESSRIVLRLKDDQDYIAVTARIQGPKGFSRTIYFQCHESVTAIECPQTINQKINTDRIAIDWNSGEVAAGLYTVLAFARVDNINPAATATAQIEVKTASCDVMFADVRPNDPACQALVELRHRGIWYGTVGANGERLADLDRSLNRAEFFALGARLYEKANQPRPRSFQSLLKFNDISENLIRDHQNAYWIPAAEILLNNNIVSGFLADNTLRPGSPLRMAELAKITALATGFITNYNDSLSPWYSDIMRQYNQSRINFDPENITSRRNAVMLIYDTLRLAESQIIQSPFNPDPFADNY